jgi:acyl-[acyl-carrier-protein]-phospholipid O-acyltransferase / long-chain-fatty-acid--[acyl-carrier-protein] ligase
VAELSAIFPLLAVAYWPGWVVPVAAGVLLLAVLVAVCWLRPYLLLRVFLWFVTHSIYWLRVLGRSNVPVKGAALLVCNHVSYVDWLLLMASQRRFIRFVVWAGFTKTWGLRRVLQWGGCIPIDGAGGPRAVVKSLRAASDALARGELVCIFAEGRFTQTGLMLPFHRGFEQVVKHCKAPIIPVCLDQVWGSIFSYYSGKIFWKIPLEIPYHVTVAFGEPMPNDTKAADVRQAVQKLSADCSIARSPQRVPVHRQFVRMAKRSFFRPCFSDSTLKDQDLTYGMALAAVLCIVREMRPIFGAAPMVGVWLPSSMGAAVTNIVIAILGKTSVNLNYTSAPDAVLSALRQCGCTTVLTSRRFTARLKLEPGPDVTLIYLEDFREKISKSRRARAWLMALLTPTFVLERWVLGLGRHTIDDLATVIFSSGSTGEPKGVMLTHGNIAANAESMIQAAGLEARDRLLGVLPMFHSFGYTVTLWAPLQLGASVVYHADPRQAKEIGELCKTHQCTLFVSTATFLRFCLRKCEPDDFKTLRILMCGAEKLPQSLAQEFEKKFGVLPLEGYGCTELSPVAAANIPDKVINNFRQIMNKPGTVGQPVPGVAARVVDPDARTTLPVGAEGLLLIHGANVMKGYLGQPELTAKVVHDGWYVTGDMAKIDEDGFITLTGRLSRFAKIGGEMAPLEKIEEVLNEVLGTSERVAAVTCVPDEARGERLIVLYLEQPLTQLGFDVPKWWQAVGGRGLPNLWVPGQRDFYPVPELPHLGSGKLDLKGLKDRALELTAKK